MTGDDKSRESQEAACIQGQETNSHALSSGFLLDGKYEIIEATGSGGSSRVYKAKHLALDTLVAIKLLHPQLQSSDKAKKRFLREAAAISSLQHENIVKLLAFGYYNQSPYMVIDYLEGESLANRLSRQGALPAKSAIPILAQVAAALSYAHEKGIVHRDLTPNNIMLLKEDQQVKIVDFGIASLLTESNSLQDRLTCAGDLLGSPPYMSPEQCRGEVADKRSDIYSMACMIYEVLSGKPPFLGASAFETMNKQTQETAAPLDLPNSALWPVLSKALSKDPDKRFQNADEFVQELSALLDQTELDCASGTKKGVRRIAKAMLAASLAIAALLSGAAYLKSSKRIENPQVSRELPTSKYILDGLNTGKQDPALSQKNLLTAYRLASMRQELRYKLEALASLHLFYKGKSWWLDQQLNPVSKEKAQRCLEEAKNLLIANPLLEQKYPDRNPARLVLLLELCADSCNDLTDKEIFMRSAYLILLNTRHYKKLDIFPRRLQDASSRYAQILRELGKTKQAKEVEDLFLKFKKTGELPSG